MNPTDSLLSRSEGACELCSTADGLTVYLVPPHTEFADEHAVVVCGTCETELETEPPSESHWYCLQTAAWSQVPAVQVVCLRLLDNLEGEWAADLAGQLYIEDSVRAWANIGQASAGTVTVDSNGTPLETGDTVTLIKDLVVKGAGFTAKRGTQVKGILVTEEPGIVEGRINRIGVVLKSCFLKKVT